MTAAAIFLALALAAAWMPDTWRARGPVRGAAIGMGLYGMSVHGWQGWQWSGTAFAVYIALFLAMTIWFAKRYRDEFSPKAPAVDDLAYGVIWGALQQGVLIGFLLPVHPLLPLAAFPALHLPNGFLVSVTAAAGGVVVLTSSLVEPSIPAAAIAHSLLSLVISLGLPRSVHHGMRVGWDYLADKVRIW